MKNWLKKLFGIPTDYEKKILDDLKSAQQNVEYWKTVHTRLVKELDEANEKIAIIEKEKSLSEERLTVLDKQVKELMEGLSPLVKRYAPCIDFARPASDHRSGRYLDPTSDSGSTQSV